MLPITVILPSRNSMSMLPGHIESMQQWLDLVREVIVVDSHSEDGTMELMKEKLVGDNIRFLTHPPGLYKSWNFGISQATSRYVYISTVGDTITREGLIHLAEVARQFDSDVVISPPRFVDEDENPVNGHNWPVHHVITSLGLQKPASFEGLPPFVAAVAFLPYAILGSSASNLYRTSVLQKYPFPTEYGSNGDGAWGVLNSLRVKFAVTPKCVSFFRRHRRLYPSSEYSNPGTDTKMIDAALLALQEINQQPEMRAEAKRLNLENFIQATITLQRWRNKLIRNRASAFPWVLNPIAWHTRYQRDAAQREFKALLKSVLAAYTSGKVENTKSTASNRIETVDAMHPTGQSAISTPARSHAPINRNLENVEQSIPERFRQIVTLHGSRTALSSDAWQPTYNDLDAATNQLAHLLISHGGGPGDRVALLLRHDCPLIAAALSVLKAGRIVVVLNSSDPPARLQQLLDDAEPTLLVTDSTNRTLAEQIVRPTCSIVSYEDHAGQPSHDIKLTISPADVAFLVYTSGSTGRPKGVMLTHRGILHNVLRLSRGMELTPEDRVVLLAALSGAQSVATTWSTLMNGATLYPFPVMEKGVVGLADWLFGHEITVYVSAASMFRHFMRTLKPDECFPSMRLVRLGAESATATDFAAFQSHFGSHCLLLHTLSSSETGNITQYLLSAKDHLTETRLPAGTPTIGVELSLVDEQGHEVSKGEVGEIIVRSRYLSPGYWRNETLTAERFFGGPHSIDLRGFRSGDLGRRTADGKFVFIGRRDNRVKIRGYRIEISEIEDALGQHAEVERAIVIVRTSTTDDAQLAAYVVARAGCTCSPESLRRALQKVLPTYMIPASFVLLERFPLTPHGKIDFETLRQINPPSQAPDDPPATDTERMLADIWKETLKYALIGRSDGFFELGGDSLSAAVVGAKVHAALAAELDLRTFAEHSRLADLAALIDRRRLSGSSETSPRLERTSRDTPLPLSFTQERIWKFSRKPEDSAGYTVACSHRIRGPLNVEVLRESMSLLIQRHEILRTTFEELKGEPVQRIHPAEPVSLPFIDLADKPDAEAQATRIFREQARRKFDLTRGPLMCFHLIRIRKDEHWLLRVGHHIIFDAWSWKIYFRELALAYEARLSGETPLDLELDAPQYADYAVWQRLALRPGGQAYQNTIKWWQTLFSATASPLKVPFSRSKPLRHADPGEGLIWWGVDPALSKRLEQITREEGATYYTIRLAAFVALLSDAGGQPDVLLGTYVTNRNRVESQNMFGPFANLATLHFRHTSSLSFREWLSSVRKVVSETQAHCEIPYEQVCEEMRAKGIKPPEIRFIFSISDQTAPVLFGGLELTWLDRRMETMPWGFTFAFDQHNEGRRCRVSFDARIYDPARVRDFINRFLRFLDVVSRNPDLPVAKSLAMIAET